MRVCKRDVGHWCLVKYDNPPKPQRGIIIEKDGIPRQYVHVFFPKDQMIDVVEQSQVIKIGVKVRCASFRGGSGTTRVRNVSFE